jgi:predicted DNA-binding transcriptional regulator AlpA
MPVLTPSVLNSRQVADLFGISTVTLRSWVHAGRFPKPFQPGGERGKCFWHPSVIEQALLSRQADVQEEVTNGGPGGLGGPRSNDS